MKRYGGIDLHSNNSVIALLDEQDQGVYRRKPLPIRVDFFASMRREKFAKSSICYRTK